MEQKYIWLALLLAICYQLYSNERHRNFVENLLKGDIFKESDNNGERLFTVNELEQYNRLDKGLYLSIIGKVFDVSKGAEHYGPGATYHFFTGRDASVAFITGEFTEGMASDNVFILSNSQLKSIDTWINFYEKNYIYKGKFLLPAAGKLIGLYYDSNGNPTENYEKFKERVKLAEDTDKQEEERKKMFPPCNVEWKADVGSRVWCTRQSGGVSRDWIGVPRQYFERSESGQQRCACVNLDSQIYKENIAKIREYKDCPQQSDTCIISTNE